MALKVRRLIIFELLLAANNIVAVQLPPNCIDKLQPLDLSVNKPVKDGMKAKF